MNADEAGDRTHLWKDRVRSGVWGKSGGEWKCRKRGLQTKSEEQVQSEPTVNVIRVYSECGEQNSEENSAEARCPSKTKTQTCMSYSLRIPSNSISRLSLSSLDVRAKRCKRHYDCISDKSSRKIFQVGVDAGNVSTRCIH